MASSHRGKTAARRSPAPLVAISPDYEVRVSPRLLNDDDGPMLDLLKTFDGSAIYLPRRTEWKPDRERLAVRFERFLGA